MRRQVVTGRRRSQTEKLRGYRGRRARAEPPTTWSPPLITVRPDDSLTHAIRLMMQHQVKRLIVGNETGAFRGLIDRREVLRMLADDAA
ncbi:MAG TPA: CBS domain-containing protein [Methylomirabilota bacterium]|nr:CBS domain-containing protein [Methylomirabilota bacterium]